MFIITFLKRAVIIIFLSALPLFSSAQIKILFDNVKGETSGNTADWTVDAPLQNLCWSNTGSGYTGGSCYHSDPVQIPLPAQSGITAGTAETYWTGALSNWGVDLVKLGYGYVIESLPYSGSITYGNASNPQDLSNYKVFIMCEPNTHLTTTEKTALVQFVNNGGGLYIISDHNGSDRNNDGWDSPHIWLDFANSTGNVFGIKADTVNVSPTIYSFPTLPNDSCLHGPLGTVTGIKYHAGTTFTIDPSANPTVVGIAYNSGTSGNTGVLAGHARYGRGKVAFLGDSSPCDDGTGNTANPNISLVNSYTADVSGSHRILLINTTVWLATQDSTSSGGALTLSPSGSTSVCAGHSVTLTASGASSYSWSPGGSTSPSITVSPTTATTYTVSGIVSGATQTQTVTVTVNPLPTPQFTTSLTGMAVTVTNQSQNATSYTWNFGDGSAQVSGSSPSAHTYAANGTYTVMLITSNACGTDTMKHNITLTPLTVTPSGTITVCHGQPTTLTASGASSYSWSPGGSTSATITVTPATTTTYTVTGSVNGVNQTKTVTVMVNNAPTPLFTTSLNGMAVTVTNQSQNATSYTWNFGDGSAQVSGSSPSAHSYAANGTYTIMLITSNSCGTDTITHSITLNGLSLNPNGATSVCLGQPITLTASGASSYSWAPGGSTSASITVSPTTTTIYTVSGVISGVTQTQTVTVTVQDVPAPSFTTNTTGATVSVTNTSQNANSFTWYFGDGSASVSGSAPAPHAYAANGTYSILLISDNNCGPDSTTQQVVISVLGIAEAVSSMAKIYQIIPNPAHDRIEVMLNDPMEVSAVSIYNDLGQIIYHTDRKSDTTLTIDISGIARGVYFVSVRGTDGSVANKRFVKE